MAEITTLVCDVCRNGGRVESYSVVTPTTPRGKALTVDLCPDHAQPLLDLLEHGRTSSASMVSRPPAVRRPVSNQRRMKILSQEEINEIERRERNA